MNRAFTRRALLGSLGAVAASAGLAGAPSHSLRPTARPDGLARLAAGGLDALVARFGLQGQVAATVADVQTGLVLESVNGVLPLPPASVAKALTAVYALDALGPDHRFRTRLVASSAISNGVLDGDLVLEGGADPTLDTNDLAGMAAALKEAGLRELRGRFLVYDGAIPFAASIDPGQLDHVGYSPAVSGISLNFNRVHFEWRLAGGAYAVTMDARSNRYRPDVSMASMRVANRSAPVYTYSDGGRVDDWTGARGALGSGGARWLPVRKPALYAGDVFRTMARAQGIVLPAAEPSRTAPRVADVLVIHQSAPLPQVLRDMLKYSTNLTAEMVGMAATAARRVPMATLADSARAMSAWAAADLGMAGTALVDHSGLGGASAMTTDGLAQAFVRIGQRGTLRPLLKPFTLRDSQGRLLRDHPVRVDAKTGTLNFVSCLGGFMTAPDGTELAFAIFTANPEVRAAIRREDSERPPGGRSWNGRSRRVQSAMIDRWGRVYGS